MNKLIKEIFSRHWSQETSYHKNWNPNNKSYGQCAISSIVLNNLLGGDIGKMKTNDGTSHYFNIINGKIFDISSDQFKEPVSYLNFEIAKVETLLANKNTNDRYQIFKKSLFEEITKPLPLNEIEHVCIRDPNYVAGSSKNPEVKVFCQTNKINLPLKEEKLAPKQNVYMKWTSGPLVAKSKLISWHCGEFHNSNINNLRGLTIGSNLFGLQSYWSSISNKINGYYCVLHLDDEQWLDSLIYPNIQSYGSSWIYLDTMLKKIQWLTIDIEPAKENNPNRNIPKSIRFLVLKRDSFQCQYCGRKAPDVELHIDHKVPWSIVKEHKIDNLVTACVDCNLGKSDKLID